MMHSRFDFAGAEVLVVGASRAGIGAAIARAFQDAGGAVAITGAEPEPAAEDQGRFAYTQLDVTDGAAVQGFARSVPKLDILVNCAAITARGEEMAPAIFQHVVDVNLHGTFRTAEAFHGHLKAAGGALINLGFMPRQARDAIEIAPYELNWACGNLPPHAISVSCTSMVKKYNKSIYLN